MNRPGATGAALLLAGMMGCDLRIPPIDSADAGAPDASPPSVDEVLAGANCGRLTPEDFSCGGDPVGTWEILASCPAAEAWDPLEGTCPQLVASGEGEATGTVRIYPDGAYELELRQRDLELSFSFPLSCYGGATEPCNGAHFSGICELGTRDCACEVRVSLEPILDQGEWFAYGPNLAFRNAAGEQTDLQFCRVDSYVMRLVRFAPEPSDLAWGFVLRRVPDGPVADPGTRPN